MADDDSEAGSHPRERRSSARFPVEMWVEDVSDGNIVHRRAGNLSRGGLHLDNTIPVPVGSTVKLRFSVPEEIPLIEVTGRVVSVQAKDTLGMGVQFIDLDAEIARKLDDYFKRRGA